MAKLLRFLVVPVSVLFWSIAGADEPPDFIVPEAVPLPDDELQQITVSLLERYPQLAGSPGAKSASAYLSAQGRTDLATVIYYPHTERRGVKVAFQAHCRRPYESKTWACDEVVTRGYLQLASQEFEVRVLATISADDALAVVVLEAVLAHVAGLGGGCDFLKIGPVDRPDFGLPGPFVAVVPTFPRKVLSLA